LLNARAVTASGRRAVGSGQKLPDSDQLAVGKEQRTRTQQSSFASTNGLLLTAHRPLLTAGWRRLDYDIEGEWGFYLILDQFLKVPAESRRAVAGWGGDHFAVYEGPKGESLFVSHSIWDNEIDAREFFDAYVKRTELRYLDAVRVESSATDQTRNPKLETRNSDAISFRTSAGSVVIELRGSRVLILEGVPDGVDSKSLVKEILSPSR
jgi:hypothetical protein